MKKNTTPTTSPTPAKKSAAPFPATSSTRPPLPVRAPTPVAAPAAKAKRVAAPKKVADPIAPVVKAVVPIVKPVAPKSVATTISAKIDIGFGNALYIRGEGAGLSWDRGLLLDCVSDDHWSVKLGESARPIVFKFLVNDLSWSAGPDYVITPGSSTVFTPAF